ncbi:MAG: HD domain-containing protein [Candidatus Omnitrophica bacterium]|nr:HD domain-containing protein [Candidatus Omnitrophota bacterium]
MDKTKTGLRNAKKRKQKTALIIPAPQAPFDYKKELEAAARNMILVHDPDMLIKMTADTIVDKLRVKHVSVLLQEKDAYILSVSRGNGQIRFPVGMARVDKENPIIVFFKRFNDRILFKRRAVVYRQAKGLLKSGGVKDRLCAILEHVLYQMEVFDASACVPSYVRDNLLGVLLLGPKLNNEEFSDEEVEFFIALASHMAMAIRNAQLFKELELELDRKKQLFIRTTIALAAAIEAKDHYTHGHTTRVTNISKEIAMRLGEGAPCVNEKFIEDLEFASLLHDIGKIGIPEYILNKEGPLNDDERIMIRKHPAIGVGIIKSIKELEGALQGVRYHHERYDGLGYPEGLKGHGIPLIASIISVADSFDAMTTDRPYRRRLSKADALAEIRQLSGKQFDPRVTHAFFKLYQENRI